MKILLCPDKFKGSISADEVCYSLSKGLLSANKNLELSNHPLADGGDGSIEILKTFLQLKPQHLHTEDPLGREIETWYYLSENAAFIELASASGITLLADNELNVLESSTRGSGKMIKDAIELGIQNIFLLVGGSATNDGGMGIACVLGFDFLDKYGHQLEPIGANLSKIDRIQNNSPHEFSDINITILCDVTNTMHGPNGAAYVYGKQKGASEQDMKILDDGLRNFAQILNTQLQFNISELSGIGAGGAVGASLVGLLGSNIENGFQLLANITKLEDAIKGADLVITGEGKIDSTSFQGKVVGNVLAICQKYKVPCCIVGGIIEDLNHSKNDFTHIRSIIALADDLNDAIKHPKKYLSLIGRDIGENL